MTKLFMADLSIGDPQPMTADDIISFFEIRLRDPREIQRFIQTAQPGDWMKFEGLGGMTTDSTLTLVAINSERPAT